MVKNLPANIGDTEMQGRSLGWEDPLKEGLATYCSILALGIPWMEEPGRVQSIGLQRVKNYWSDLACTHASLNEVIRVDSKQYDLKTGRGIE